MMKPSKSDVSLGLPSLLLIVVGTTLIWTRPGWLANWVAACGCVLCFVWAVVSLLELRAAKRKVDRIMARWTYRATHLPAQRKPED